MDASWLLHLILDSAVRLEKANKTRFRFAADVEQALARQPVREWEADRWARGMKRRLVRVESPFFRVGQSKPSALSFFVRNDQGLYVGLRRESLTQAATYVSLITDLGYGRSLTRFETGWMDVAVFDDQGKAHIYAENKASEKVLNKLCARLCQGFKDGVPFPPEDEARRDDGLMKAQHIWRHRPRYFWGVAPEGRQAYRVEYSRQGFWLSPLGTIPDALEWTPPNVSPAA